VPIVISICKGLLNAITSASAVDKTLIREENRHSKVLNRQSIATSNRPAAAKQAIDFLG
jgi:hypothetical protein